jgi:hypothetical protein
MKEQLHLWYQQWSAAPHRTASLILLGLGGIMYLWYEWVINVNPCYLSHPGLHHFNHLGWANLVYALLFLGLSVALVNIGKRMPVSRLMWSRYIWVWILLFPTMRLDMYFGCGKFPAGYTLVKERTIKTKPPKTIREFYQPNPQEGWGNREKGATTTAFNTIAPIGMSAWTFVTGIYRDYDQEIWVWNLIAGFTYPYVMIFWLNTLLSLLFTGALLVFARKYWLHTFVRRHPATD